MNVADRRRAQRKILDLYRGGENERASGGQRLEVSESLEPERMELLKVWAEDSWKFVTGIDIDGEPVLWTKDERDKENPVKPFPDWPYLREYFKVMRHERLILADKCRQMMLTTGSVLHAAHECAFKFGRVWILSKNTETEAGQVLEDKVRFPWSQTPAWFRKEVPITDKPALKVLFPRTRSYILAVGENVAEAEARGTTASGVIVDEAARQPKFGKILQACLPMATQFIGLTTAEIGNPGARLYRSLLESEAA